MALYGMGDREAGLKMQIESIELVKKLGTPKYTITSDGDLSLSINFWNFFHVVSLFKE